MDKNQAQNLIKTTFENSFDKSKYRNFVINLLDGVDESKEFTCGNAYVPESFRKYVTSYGRIGKYLDSEGCDVEVLWVCLKNETSLERARTIQRNFVAWYLNGGRGGVLRHNALVAFYNESVSDWRFSFVKLDVGLKQDETGKIKVINEFTPAKRYSFLVGELEPNHTAQSRLIGLLTKDYPLVSEIEEAFNVEKVSKEFFANYKELFLQLVDNLKEIRANDERINVEFTLKSITEANFCKKLLGQLIFLYFIQKKGWLGVPVGKKWGEGDKQFLRHTFERAVNEGKNFFNDYLEHLFYDALANGERDEQYFSMLNCKIPFLNGGLFETICGYDWVNTDIVFENDIFSNNIKTKNGDIGTGILDVFDRYNFTVKEDEPLEKEVAVDPEMLGKVFEELLEVQDRKSKGAFYTPREIVHYMCQESLINYLTTELNAVDNTTSPLEGEVEVVGEDLSRTNSGEGSLTKQDLADFIHHSDKLSQSESIATKKDGQSLTYTHKISQAIIDNAEQIDKALENIKICDPAIGSGAFPVGMLNEIVRARIALVDSGYLSQNKKRSVYEYKRQAIQNSIYGVDIEPGAVEIAKLRLWLSLVVDEENIENIKALPNLDYKIVQGNSLLDLYGVIIPDNLQTRFNELVDLLFDETTKNKKKSYQIELERIKNEVFRIAESLGCKATFDFNFFFHEVFKQGGFDVIIANPPYVGEKGHKEIFEPIKNCSLKEFYLGKMDLFYFFFHLALNILKPNGQCAFITTNYYITALGARLLRRDFKERAILKELINFNELKIFESALGQHNLITIFQKGHNKDKKCNLINVNKKGFLDNTFDDIVTRKDKDTNYNSISQNELYEGEENYIRLSKEDENSELSVILNKIKSNNDVLGNICNVNNGVFSGCDTLNDKKKLKYNIDKTIGDGVFTISSKEYSNLQLFDNEKSIIKKLFKNSDINKYSCNLKNELYLINLRYTDRPNLDDYPHIKEHLLPYKTMLSDRPTTGTLESAFSKGYWYIMSTSRRVNMEHAKIVAPQRSKTNTFGYNECEWYASADVYFITEPKYEYNLKYILALLNSNLYYIWLYNKGKRKGESLELYQKPLSEIPIKKADEQTQNKFISVVDKILAITQTEDYLQNEEKQNAVKEYEKQIDIMVYKLYDLNYNEVLTIDKDFMLTEQQYKEYQL